MARRHINPALEMYRDPRPIYDYFNAPKRAGYNPNWRKPGDPSGHDGCDLYANKGTLAVASCSGPVHHAGWHPLNASAGIHVEILSRVLDEKDHMSRALHLSKVFVSKGEWVEQGQAIGEVGCTGLCNSPHIHFAIRELDSYNPKAMGVSQKGRWLDPLSEGILEEGEPPPPPSPSEPFTISRPNVTHFGPPYLKVPNVQDLQALLARQGFLSWEGNNENGVFDGFAGPRTQKAVKDFQNAHSLPPNGMVDSATWKAILDFGDSA